MSNEKRIRELSKLYLHNAYNDITVKDEFGTFLNARTDLIGLNEKHIITVEIKSDCDTFARLENQLDTYKTISTGVYVALDKSHYKKFKEKFLKDIDKYAHVGILIYDGNTDILELKRPIKHYYEYPFLYKMLTSNELTQFFMYFKRKSLIPKDEKTSSIIIENIFTYREIFNISKEIFLNRFTGYCGFNKKLIKEINYKQELFNNWLKEENWNMYEYKSFIDGKYQLNGKVKRSSLLIEDL